MNSEIENKLLQMFIKISEDMSADRGSASGIEKTKDEVNSKLIYEQEFFFGKNNEEHKYKAQIITDISGNIIEEKCEEI